MRSTHTYVELEISAAAYEEIAKKLRAASYDHAFNDGAIDMHGLALIKAAPAQATQSTNDKPILCIDFDGVVHSYTSGWKGVDVIPDPPTPGFFEWAFKAAHDFKLAIYSSRSKEPRGREAMAQWLAEQWVRQRPDAALAFHMDHNVANVELMDPTGVWITIYFAHEKPAAYLTIDDRAICFDGRWPDPQALRHFRPWNVGERQK